MDTEKLLRCLNDHGVKYVVIGATAFPIHGYARATLDVDFLLEPSPENAARTLEALRTFGYDVADLTAADLLQYKVLVRQYVVEADFHPNAAGVTFDGVWKRRIEAPYGSTATAFASLDDLILMKEAAGRPKDLEDLRYLRKLRERRDR